MTYEDQRIDLLEDLYLELIQRDAAERRESELGLQVVAQAARLRLADSTIAACRFVIADSRVRVEGVNAALDALAAWDAVPGDNR